MIARRHSLNGFTPPFWAYGLVLLVLLGLPSLGVAHDKEGGDASTGVAGLVSQRAMPTACGAGPLPLSFPRSSIR